MIVALISTCVLMLLIGFIVGVVVGATITRSDLAKKAGTTIKEIRARESLLRDAVALLRNMLVPTDLDRVDSLSPESRRDADAIVNRYNKEVK